MSRFVSRLNGLKWVLIALICCAPPLSHAQKFSFLGYSNNVGLPQSQVQAITQDHEGYLWVGTLGGLAKFNGKKFTVFPLENGLLNNRVSCLKQIGKQTWVGHLGGISVIENNKAKAWSFPAKEQNNAVTGIVRFNETIYVAVEGGGVYFQKGDKFQQITFPNNEANTCRSLCIFKNQLLVGTKDGLYAIFMNNGWKKISAFESVSISGIYNSAKGAVITTFNDGFYRSNATLTKFTMLENIPEIYISGGIVDHNNQLWAITDAGILNWKSKGRYTKFSMQNGMPTEGINCVFEDADGTIWIGSDGKGLLRFCGEQWAYFNISTGLVSDLIMSGEKNGSNYLFGSYDQGAFSMTSNGISTKLNIPASTVWSIESWKGENYFATDLGLFHQTGQNQFQLVNNNPQVTHSLLSSPLGLIVVGEDEIGIVKFGKYKKVNFSKKDWAKFGVVRKMVKFGQSYYLGTSNGLFELDLDNHTILSQKTFASGVFSLATDNFERLWIGTENGLHYFDGITYHPFSLGNISGSKFINFLELVNDKLCIGTNNGLFIVECDQDLMITDHFGLNSGLLNLESNINSCFYDQEFLWFGTAEGLVRFDINAYLANENSAFKPTIVSTGFNVNFEPYDFSFSSLNGTVTKPINLSYARNNISIDLDALFLNDPESVFIQYRIEGLSDKWSPPTSNSAITLNNLPDGQFVLQIRAVNAFGMDSQEIEIPIYIRPPYYRTWWFYFILVVIVVAAVRYYFRWQIRRERDRNYQENLENRTRLIALEQQSLNASMNRHFIFNSLNSIQYFINTQDKNSANRYLSNFAKLIRKNLDSATENENMVTLSQELERLELYLSLESMRFKDRFTYLIDTDHIDTEQIEVPSMLLQPFVENSIIHGILPNESVQGRIEIRVKVIGHQLEICIDDNGIGIDVSMNKKASFSGDHKSKGMEITSKRISLIRTMLKKDFDLIGPFQIANSDQTIKGTRVLIKIPYENLDY